MSDTNTNSSEDILVQSSKQEDVQEPETKTPRKTVGVIQDMTHDKLSEEEIIENHDYLEPVKHKRRRKRIKPSKKEVPQLHVNPYTKYLSTPSSKHTIFSSSELNRRKRRTAIVVIAILIAITICIYLFA